MTNETDDLPNISPNWVWTKLSTVIKKIKRGPSLKCNYEGKGIRYITSGNLQNGHLQLGLDYKFLDEFDDIEKCQLLPGDLILNCVNSLEQIGKSAVFNESFGKAIVGFNNYALELCPEILPEYANIFCQSEVFKKQIYFLVKKAINQVSFATKELDKVYIPLPPLNEQRRIVAKIDALFARSRRAREYLAAIPPLLEKFRQSVLAAAFRGDLTKEWREKNKTVEPASSLFDELEKPTLPDNWVLISIGNIIEGLKYGTAQKCEYDINGTPVLRIPNIGNGVIVQTDMKYAELPSKELEQLRLASGDILLIRSNGSVSLVGKSAIVRETEKDFAYAGYLIRIRPNRFFVLPEYLNLALSSYDIRQQIEIPARSTSGVHNINSEEVKRLRIPLAPLEEQQQIIEKIQALLKIADSVEDYYQNTITQLDALDQSILSKAFRGELVPQDPNDEPASVLLERIKAERAASETAKAKPKTKQTKGEAKQEEKVVERVRSQESEQAKREESTTNTANEANEANNEESGRAMVQLSLFE